MTTNKSITGLIKRLLGFYQTPCTILDGVQYSWAIPLGHSPNTVLDRRSFCLADERDISIYLAALDCPNTCTLTEFEHGYATKSNLSVPQLHALGGHAAPCACGQDGCKGWQMVTQ